MSPTERLRRHAGLLLALVVSLLCLVLFLRRTSWVEVWAAIRGVGLGWLGLSVLAIWVSVLLRAVRWGVLLRDVKRIRLGRLYNLQMIGLMINGLFPARVGEVARAYLLGRKEDRPFLGLFASVVAERVLDLAFVIALLVVVLVTFPFPADATAELPGLDEPVAVAVALRRTGGSFAVFFAGVVALVGLLVWRPLTARRALEWACGLVSRGLSQRLGEWLASFAGGLGVFRRWPTAAQAVLWTLLVWLGILLSAFCLFPAFGLDIGFLGACLLTAALALAVALPQAPGYLGVFHLAATLVLVSCFGVAEPVAKAYAIVLWFVQLVPVIALGFFSLLHEGLALREVSRLRPPGESLAGASRTGHKH